MVYEISSKQYVLNVSFLWIVELPNFHGVELNIKIILINLFLQK